MTEDNLHIKSGMQVPENYFDRFKKELMNQVELEEYVPKKESFSIPENYFEQSKQAILKATTNKPKTINLSFVRYAAASVLGVLLISSVWMYLSKNQENNIHFSDLTSVEIQNYLDDTYLEDKNYLILDNTDDIQFESLFVNETINNIDNYLSEYDYRLEEY